jgi:NAD-dependent SIR2 family protein deacetylase
MIQGRDGNFLTIDQLDKDLVVKLKDLKVGEYSQPLDYTDERGKKGLRVIYLKSKSEPHRENLKDDYNKIAQRAIEEKKETALEKWFDVTVVTQNIDNLHELAGSTKVIHLHGEITKLRSENNRRIKQEWNDELQLGQLAEDGSQLRPDVVWFGEELDSDRIEETKKACKDVVACIIVGTSMQVSPANSIPFLTPETCLLYYVDPGDKDFHIPKFREYFFYHFQEVASIGMEQVKEDLLLTFKIQS